MKIKVYTDGATVGHNGKLGTVKEVGLGVYMEIEDLKIEENYGSFINCLQGNLNFSVSKKDKGISNNEAEFKAIILGIHVVARSLTELNLKPETAIIKFHADSQIIVNRMNGSRAKGKQTNERMDKFQDEALGLVGKHFTKELVSFNWIPREQNKKADELSKEACKLTLE